MLSTSPKVSFLLSLFLKLKKLLSLALTLFRKKKNMKIITGGNFVYANGLPVSNGILTFQLLSNLTLSGGGQLSQQIVSFQLDANGNLPVGATILANDEISPAGSTYTVNLYASNGSLAYGAEQFAITGPSPINISNILPQNAQVDVTGAAPDVFFISIQGGSFLFNDGTPVVNGHIQFSLPFDEDIISGGHIARTPVQFLLDNAGNIEPGAFLFTNDGMTDADIPIL